MCAVRTGPDGSNLCEAIVVSAEHQRKEPIGPSALRPVDEEVVQHAPPARATEDDHRSVVEDGRVSVAAARVAVRLAGSGP